MESSHQVWFMNESKQSEAADSAVPTAWRRWEWPLLGLLFVVSIAQVFRFALLSRFQLLFGDPIDGLIETSILEHWWNVARGLTGWKQTFYLYPSKGTLGYNDGYFLYGLVYSVYRAMGLDPFLSSELVNMSVRTLGFAGFVAFARLVLRLPLWAAAVGAAIFTASDNSYFQGAHVQLLSVALAPVEALLLALFVSAISRELRRRAAALGVGAALLLAAWFLTSFYMAWFFVLFCAIWAPLLAVWLGRARTGRFLRACWRCRIAVLLSLAALVLGLLPTARMYLAVMAGVGAHDLNETASYMVPPLDVVNFGAGNLLWGWLHDWMRWALPVTPELATGFTPLLLVVFLGGLVAATLRRSILPASLGMATVLCWLLAVQVGGWSAWNLVFAYAPAGAVIRVVARLQLFLDWPLVSVAATGLARLAGTLRHRPVPSAALAGALALATFAEQANSTRIPGLDRAAELAVFRRIGPKPPGCHVFFAFNAGSPDPGYGPVIRGMVQHNVDAMIAAEWTHVPTINGYATKTPALWNLLSAEQPDYRDRVRAYAGRYGLLPVLCGLDMQTGRWEEHPFGG